MFRDVGIDFPAPVFISEMLAHHAGQTNVAVALNGYYDGTGSPESQHHGQIIGLAGYAARPEVWDAFEAEWWRVLNDNSERPICRCWHTTDAKALQCEFSRERGWTNKAVDSLIHDIFNKCFSPRGLGQPIPEVLVGSACTVDLHDYERVCAEYPHFAEKVPEALCVDHVVTTAIQQLIPEDRDGMHFRELVDQRQSIQLFFDRGEPFRHHINRVWEAFPYHRRPWPLRLVHTISVTDRESSAALQAADFLAWHTNRDVAAGDMTARAIAMFASRCSILHYDYDELRKTASRWRKNGGYESVPAPE